MKVLHAAGTALLAIERFIIVLILSVTLILAFSQVVLRNLFQSGFLWADPLLRHMVLWVGFLGASMATHHEKHINLDIFTRYFSPGLVHFVRTFTSLFAAGVTGFLAHAGWTFLENERELSEALVTIGGTSLPAWWFQSIIPIGFGLMSLRFVLKAIGHGLTGLGKVPHATETPVRP